MSKVKNSTKTIDSKSGSVIIQTVVKKPMQNKSSKLSSKFSEAEAVKLIADLKFRQVELEKQNERLSVAKRQAEINAEKYSELFDFAPAGYFTISKQGKVIDLNVCGAKMMCNEKSKIKNCQFSFFVSNNTKSIFNIFLDNVFKSENTEFCEVTLYANNRLPMHVHLSGIAVKNSEQCIIAAADISHYGLMNDAAVKTEQRFQTLAEVAPVGIFHTDATGFTTYVNPSWCQITGLSEDEALGNNWLNAVHADDKEKLKKGWARAVKTQKISISEYRFIRRDGSIAWVMGQATPERNLDNQILGYVGTITDITGRKLVEEKQREDQEFLKETQLIARLGTYNLDITSNSWVCSEILDNIFGINAAFEKNIENWITIIHPEWTNLITEYFNEEVIGKKTKFDKEYKIVRLNDGAERWVHGLGRLKFNSNNQPVSMVGTIRDITDSKQMEIELIKAKVSAEESESKFRNYVENAPDGVIVTDEEGNFLETNPAATLITGFSKEELLRMSVKDLSALDVLEASLTQFQILLDTGSLKNDAKFLHKNGSARWVSVEAVKLSESRVIGFFKDITQRKEAEEEIVKSNERFELIAKATNDGLWDWEMDTNNLWANEIHQQLYGLTKDDPVPDYDEWMQRIHPEDRERTVKAFEIARGSGKKSHAEEYRFYTENSGWMNVFGRTFIERNAKGEPVRLIGSMIDITEQKKAEEELLKSKQQFQNLVENISGVYWVNNLETYQTLYISPSYETIWGRKCEDLMKNPADFINAVHPDDQPDLFEAHKNIGNTLGMNLSYRIVRPDGTVRWVSAKTKVVVDDAGNKMEYGYAEDITENKKAEEALQNAEKRLQFLLSATPAVIYSCQAEYPFAATFISENIIDQTGYMPNEFIDNSNFWANNIHPDDKQRVMNNLGYAFDKGRHNHEYRFRVKNGSYMWVHDEIKLIADTSGKPLEMVGYWINIDKRKQVEEAIKASEEKYRTLVEQASDAIFIADTQGKFITVNSSLCKMTEYSEEELSHLSIYDFAIPEDIQKRPLRFDDLRAGKPVMSERVIKIKNDKLLHIEINSKLLTDGRLLAFVRDISQRKKAERALADSENRLRTIVQSEPECIKLLTINGEMEDINPAGLEMLEADSKEQVIGKSVFDTINKPYQKAYKKIVKNGFSGKPGTIEYEITGYKGTVRWFDTHAVPLRDAEGEIISLLCVTRNITDRKKAEEEIKNTTEELRQLTAHLQIVREEERKRIGREIHDELGQQLTAIKMDVVWIDKKIPEAVNTLKSKLKNIIGLLDGSNQSIRRILSELRPVILDDHGLLEAMEWLGNQFTANTGIPVRFSTTETEIKASEPVATCIFRVYQEAFTNITRHAGASKIATSLRIVADKIIVRIADNGKGFNLESVQNKKSFGIFGMKERVLSLDGKFELISSPGKGTEVIMTLPFTNKL